LDFDNGTEFLNKAVIKWAGEMEIFFTRSRPCKKNDQATFESKNNHLVRKYGFYYRYDQPGGPVLPSTRGRRPARSRRASPPPPVGRGSRRGWLDVCTGGR
jgi:hypothetical protein